MGDDIEIEAFIAQWRDTGGSELANTQSFINGLCRLIGVAPPDGSRTDDAHNGYVFERRVFQDNGDGTNSFGRIDAYRRSAFILEAKQGSDADRAAVQRGEDDLDLFGQTATTRMKRGTARRGTPGWAKAMVQAKGQAERYAKALPIDHGWPPFLLITDIGYCIEVYADSPAAGRRMRNSPTGRATASCWRTCATPTSANGSPRSGPIPRASMPRPSRLAPRGRSPTCSPPYRAVWKRAAIRRRRSAAF